MAKDLIWRDLSAEQLEQIRNPHPKKGFSGRDLLARFCGIVDPSDARSAITLDLYAQSLRFGQGLGLKDDKLSGLFSIIKEVHTKSTQQKMQVEHSFTLFKELLQAHSAQRPPYSIGLFTLAEMQAIMSWALDTYYRHYKLYMYAFTDRVLMSVKQAHPLDSVELAPQVPPLMDAVTEDEHMMLVSEEQQQAEERERQQVEAEAAAAEAVRLAHMRELYAAAVPDEIKDEVAAAVQSQLSILRMHMEEQFQAQQSSLQARLEELQAKGAVST